MDMDKSLGQTLEQLRDDLKSFIETRYELLRAELSESMKKAIGAAVLIGVAALFAVTGLILIEICIALAVAFGFGAFQNEAGLVWGFLITGGCSLLLGAVLGAAGKTRLTEMSLAPKRTMKVLERDQETLKKGPGGDYGDESIRRRA